MAALVKINYPTGGTVPGGGGFYIWGNFIGGVGHASTATVKWTGGSPLNGISFPGPAPCSWAFRFDNVAVGPTITLTVQGQDSMGNLSQDQVTFTCGGLILERKINQEGPDSQECPQAEGQPPG